MNDVKRVSLVMDGDVLLGVVGRTANQLGGERRYLWRPFSLNTDRTFTELGQQTHRAAAETAIRNSWGVGK